MSDVAHATPTPAPSAPVEEKAPYKLKEINFGNAEFCYARLSATLPVDVKFEECLAPEFWAQIAYRLAAQPVTGDGDQTGAVIEIRSEDNGFYAELYVRAVQKQGLVVSILREPVYFGPKKITSKRFRAQWAIAKNGFDIIRKSDSALVGDGKMFPTKESVQRWIDENMKE